MRLDRTGCSIECTTPFWPLSDSCSAANKQPSPNRPFHKERRWNVETELVDIRPVYQAAGQAEARRDLNVARFFDLMLPIPFEPLLKYLRRGSLVNFGKLLEGKRVGHPHNIRINGL
jgi:hypothetical protein